MLLFSVVGFIVLNAGTLAVSAAAGKDSASGSSATTSEKNSPSGVDYYNCFSSLSGAAAKPAYFVEVSGKTNTYVVVTKKGMYEKKYDTALTEEIQKSFSENDAKTAKSAADKKAVVAELNKAIEEGALQAIENDKMPKEAYNACNGIAALQPMVKKYELSFKSIGEGGNPDAARYLSSEPQKDGQDKSSKPDSDKK